MSFLSAAKSYFVSEETEIQEQEYRGPVLRKPGSLNILVRSPKSFSDVREYADSLLNGSAIMVSFDQVDPTLKNRIFDYLNGVSYIANATVRKINDDLLMYAPAQVSVEKENKKASRSWL